MFELLFKYPASVFHKGHFVLLTPWPLWALGAAILVAAGFLFWHVSRNRGVLTGLRPICICLLETSLIALLLFLLWHPALSVATLRPQQNVVAVLIDDSRSMSIPDASGTRMAAAQAALKNGLLQSLGRALRPGGRLALDASSNAESRLPNFCPREWNRIGDILFLEENDYDHLQGRMITHYTFVRDGKEEKRTGSHRIYTYREIFRMLEEAGFAHVESYASLSRETFKLGANQLLMEATKAS